jgi:hypothetical protein
MAKTTSRKSKKADEAGESGMIPSTDSDTILLKQDELMFLMRLLELPDLPGVGQAPWGKADLETARKRFREAGVALHKRGWASLDKNQQPIVESTAKAALYACAYPAQMTAIAIKPREGGLKQIYHYRKPAFDVRHTLPKPHVHSFEILPRSDMGYAEVRSALNGHRWSSSGLHGSIKQDHFDQAQKTALTDVSQSARMLIESGLGPDLAHTLSAVMGDLEVKVMIQWVYQLNPKIDRNLVSLLAGKDSCWMAESALRNGEKMVNLKAMNDLSLKQLIGAAFAPFNKPIA